MATKKILIAILTASLSLSAAGLERKKIRVDAVLGKAWIVDENSNKIKVDEGDLLSFEDRLYAEKSAEIFITYWGPDSNKMKQKGFTGRALKSSMWNMIRPVEFQESLDQYLQRDVTGGASRSDNACLLPDKISLPSNFQVINLLTASCPGGEAASLRALLIIGDKAIQLDNYSLHSVSVKEGEYVIEWRHKGKEIHRTAVQIDDAQYLSSILSKLEQRSSRGTESDREKLLIIGSYLAGYELLAFKVASVASFNGRNYDDWFNKITEYIYHAYTPVELNYK